MNNWKQIFSEGLWHNNVGLIQLLGLCPLLAISNSVVNALGLGLATTLTMIASNVTVSLVRNALQPEIRIPAFVLVIASVVTALELIMHAYFFELYQVLGIFIPLIVTNCSIIARAESFASKNPVFPSFLDGLAMGAGFTLALVALGAMREIIGMGTILADAHLLFGEGVNLTLTLFDNYRGFLIAALPAGAFIGLGFLVAAKRWLDDTLQQRQQQKALLPVEVRST